MLKITIAIASLTPSASRAFFSSLFRWQRAGTSSRPSFPEIHSSSVARGRWLFFFRPKFYAKLEGPGAYIIYVPDIVRGAYIFMWSKFCSTWKMLMVMWNFFTWWAIHMTKLLAMWSNDRLLNITNLQCMQMQWWSKHFHVEQCLLHMENVDGHVEQNFFTWWAIHMTKLLVMWSNDRLLS